MKFYHKMWNFYYKKWCFWSSIIRFFIPFNCYRVFSSIIISTVESTSNWVLSNHINGEQDISTFFFTFEVILIRNSLVFFIFMESDSFLMKVNEKTHKTSNKTQKLMWWKKYHEIELKNNFVSSFLLRTSVNTSWVHYSSVSSYTKYGFGCVFCGRSTERELLNFRIFNPTFDSNHKSLIHLTHGYIIAFFTYWQIFSFQMNMHVSMTTKFGVR